MTAKWRAGQSVEEANFHLFYNEFLTGILTTILFNLYFLTPSSRFDLRCSKTT